MQRKTQRGYKNGIQNAERVSGNFKTGFWQVEKVSVVFQNWVSECREGLNRVFKLGLRILREFQWGFNAEYQHVEKDSMGFEHWFWHVEKVSVGSQNWVSECRESLNRV